MKFFGLVTATRVESLSSNAPHVPNEKSPRIGAFLTFACSVCMKNFLPADRFYRRATLPLFSSSEFSRCACR